MDRKTKVEELEDSIRTKPYMQKKKDEYKEEWEIAFEEGRKQGYPDQLDLLLKEIVYAPDEATARWILSTIPA